MAGEAADESERTGPGNPDSVALDVCVRALTMRACSRHELAEKLRRRGIPEDAAERVLDKLERSHLVDDEAFAEMYVRSSHRDRGLSRAALRRELARKGVDAEIAGRAAEAVDDDAERARAAELVGKKLDSALFAGPVAARRRLLGLLARRGYPASISLPVVEEALRGFEASDDDETGRTADDPCWPDDPA